MLGTSNVFLLKNDWKRSMLRQRPVAVSCIKPLASCIYSLFSQWKATLRNDVEFATVYPRIYCHKYMTLSNQMLRCICNCIRIRDNCIQFFYLGNYIVRYTVGTLVLVICKGSIMTKSNFFLPRLQFQSNVNVIWTVESKACVCELLIRLNFSFHWINSIIPEHSRSMH